MNEFRGTPNFADARVGVSAGVVRAREAVV